MRDGTIKVDVAMIMVTPPDENGKVSTGVAGDYTVQAVKSAKTVIAQVNKNVPFTYGDAVFDVDDIDIFTEADTPLPTLPEAKIGEIEEAIGKNCAQLIEDGATLQLGIGAIPDAVCHQLKHKRHLGIHSEMLGDGVVELYEAGVVDNSRKGIDKGKFVFNFVMGSKRLYLLGRLAESAQKGDIVSFNAVKIQCYFHVRSPFGLVFAISKKAAPLVRRAASTENHASVL